MLERSESLERPELLYNLLCLLQLLSPLDGISLILGPPLSHFCIGLGQGPLQFRLSLLFLLILLPQQFTVMPGGLQGMGQAILSLEMIVE